MNQSSAHYSDDDVAHDAELMMRVTDCGQISIWSGQFCNTATKLQKHRDFRCNGIEAEMSRVRLLSGMSAVIRAGRAAYDFGSVDRSVRASATPLAVQAAQTFFTSLPAIYTLDHKGADSLSSSDGSFKQLKRDVERDSFIINDTFMSGPRVGTEFILCNISDLVNFFLSESSVAHFSKNNLKALSEYVLRVACRTNSGGATFLTLQKIIDPTTAMILPDSRRAAPLRIDIYLGDRYSSCCGGAERNIFEYGIVLSVKCSTSFLLEPCDADSEPSYSNSNAVDGVYENISFCDLDTKSGIRVRNLSEMVMFQR